MRPVIVNGFSIPAVVGQKSGQWKHVTQYQSYSQQRPPRQRKGVTVILFIQKHQAHQKH